MAAAVVAAAVVTVGSGAAYAGPAGTTVAGGNGDGSAANQLSFPNGVAVDGSGNVYVVEAPNDRVQRWAPNATSGVTVAGGNDGGSCKESPCNAANELDEPFGVFVDGSLNVYVADSDNSRVQRWAPNATSGTTVAGGNGSGSAANQLAAGAFGVWVDGAGNVYVSDTNNHRVQRWAPGATSGTTVAGGNGPGSAANQLDFPTGVSVDGAGNVYVVDDGNSRVQRWAPGATSGTIVAGGNGPGSGANQLSDPHGVFVDGSGNVYVADTSNNRVQRWAPNESSGTTVAAGDGPGSAADQLNSPYGVFVNHAGDVYVADTFNHRAQMFVHASTGSCHGFGMQLTFSPTEIALARGTVTSWKTAKVGTVTWGVGFSFSNTATGAATCTIGNVEYKDVLASAKLSGVTSCDPASTDSSLYPLNGKLSLKYSGGALGTSAYVRVAGYNQQAGPDIVDLTGMVTKGGAAGATVSGNLYFDPVVQAAFNGDGGGPTLSKQYYFDNSQISTPCGSGGNPIGHLFVGDGTSLLGSQADGLTIGF